MMVLGSRGGWLGFFFFPLLAPLPLALIGAQLTHNDLSNNLGSFLKRPGFS